MVDGKLVGVFAQAQNAGHHSISPVSKKRIFVLHWARCYQLHLHTRAPLQSHEKFLVGQLWSQLGRLHWLLESGLLQMLAFQP